MFSNLLKIIISAAIVDNMVFIRYIALCSYVGVTNSIDASIGMAFAVIFVQTIATAITWIIFHLFMQGLEFLEIIVFIFTIAALVQLVEIYLKKNVPSLYKAMGIYLPLITTNCMILAVTFINIDKNYTFIESLVYALGTSFGYGLALLILAGARERLRLSNIPKFFKGYPIVFTSMALIAIAFLGFKGLIK
ncbi:MAG TPA: Rnf-Nqr domain containing protein [Caldisericia bacterium]|nr:Rnf-Nqr domain containing protein [Caldisericia bacterium]HQN48868.1 Rnf-Nqr domain containing protein [Caldisericia bacterium]HQO99381.1 Rnf-Nqr domain containing protein [Caldisericia bacterium]